MFNVPLSERTTGHAVAATLVAILIGPYAAVISVTTALIVQAVFLEMVFGSAILSIWT